jgi:hypothetical protein
MFYQSLSNFWIMKNDGRCIDCSISNSNGVEVPQDAQSDLDVVSQVPNFSNIYGVEESGDVQSESDNGSLAPNFSSNKGVAESGDVQSELDDDISVVVICSLIIRHVHDGKKIRRIVKRTIP